MEKILNQTNMQKKFRKYKNYPEPAKIKHDESVRSYTIQYILYIMLIIAEF